MGNSDTPTPEVRTEKNTAQLEAWAVQEDYEDVSLKVLTNSDNELWNHCDDREFARCQEQAKLYSGNGVSASMKVKPMIDK